MRSRLREISKNENRLLGPSKQPRVDKCRLRWLNRPSELPADFSNGTTSRRQKARRRWSSAVLCWSNKRPWTYLPSWCAFRFSRQIADWSKKCASTRHSERNKALTEIRRRARGKTQSGKKQREMKRSYIVHIKNIYAKESPRTKAKTEKVCRSTVWGVENDEGAKGGCQDRILAWVSLEELRKFVKIWWFRCSRQSYRVQLWEFFRSSDRGHNPFGFTGECECKLECIHSRGVSEVCNWVPEERVLRRSRMRHCGLV